MCTCILISPKKHDRVQHGFQWRSQPLSRWWRRGTWRSWTWLRITWHRTCLRRRWPRRWTRRWTLLVTWQLLLHLHNPAPLVGRLFTWLVLGIINKDLLIFSSSSGSFSGTWRMLLQSQRRVTQRQTNQSQGTKLTKTLTTMKRLHQAMCKPWAVRSKFNNMTWEELTWTN